MNYPLAPTEKTAPNPFIEDDVAGFKEAAG
jgi:hypothetical protein